MSTVIYPIPLLNPFTMPPIPVYTPPETTTAAASWYKYNRTRGLSECQEILDIFDAARAGIGDKAVWRLGEVSIHEFKVKSWKKELELMGEDCSEHNIDRAMNISIDVFFDWKLGTPRQQLEKAVQTYSAVSAFGEEKISELWNWLKQKGTQLMAKLEESGFWDRLLKILTDGIAKGAITILTMLGVYLSAAFGI